MKLARWHRAALAGLMALSVAGGSLAPFVAGHAAAREGWTCVRAPDGSRFCVREN